MVSTLYRIASQEEEEEIIRKWKWFGYQINVRGNRRWCPPSETKVQVLLLLLLYSYPYSTIDVTPTPTPQSVLPVLRISTHTLHDRRRYPTDADTSVWFDGCLTLFNPHTTLLTKLVSSIYNLKSNNFKKSDKNKKIENKNDNDDDDDTATTTTTTTM